MLTAIGRYLRKLRIDKNETMKDMSDKLGVSASYLSCVELGKRGFPNGWKEKLVRLYSLGEKEQAEIDGAAALLIKRINIDLSEADAPRKILASAFAQRLVSLDDRQVEQIKNILDD